MLLASLVRGSVLVPAKRPLPHHSSRATNLALAQATTSNVDATTAAVEAGASTALMPFLGLDRPEDHIVSAIPSSKHILHVQHVIGFRRDSVMHWCSRHFLQVQLATHARTCVLLPLPLPRACPTSTRISWILGRLCAGPVWADRSHVGAYQHRFGQQPGQLPFHCRCWGHPPPYCPPSHAFCGRQGPGACSTRWPASVARSAFLWPWFLRPPHFHGLLCMSAGLPCLLQLVHCGLLFMARTGDPCRHAGRWATSRATARISGTRFFPRTS